ncbi:MAG: DUF5060 domain-containing protein [Planctomycetota bacterium]
MIRTNQKRLVRGIGSAAVALAALSGAALAQDGPFLPEDGLVVIEFESGDASGDWTETSQHSGHTGTGYLRWDGPNHFHVPGHDIFGFDFQIDDPGRYHFRIRNRHDHPDSTEANDVWVRMDGGPWIKVFSWQRGQWTWATQHEFSHDDKPWAEYQLGAGLHRIEFSGRSHDFMIDRFHLFDDGVAQPLAGTHPESTRGVVNDPPVAIATATPDRIPATDNFSTVVTLDSTGSYDPDDDDVTIQWNVRGANFVNGTTPRSPVAQVTFRGGFALPVQLVVTDGEFRDAAWIDIDVLGADARFGGAGAVWHPMHLDFEGEEFAEDQNGPNPFLDRRLDVTFTAQDGTEYVVPGFFAGDGEGGGTGNVWRVRFNPDRPGIWEYSASFRRGLRVAIDDDPMAGAPVAFNGATGRFGVLPRDAEAPGLLANGRLEYVGEHYLKQRDGDYFIKTGTNSPENFLAYEGFDDVIDVGGVGIIHRYEPHRSDWREGDPLFTSSSTGYDSKGIVGALNYLGNVGVNAIYFLPMNLGGDGQDTTPFVSYANTHFAKTHYDVSRLHQWNQVLNHAQEQGILVHFVLAETEIGNETWLDGGEMGEQRRLFFRELSARFGYLNGVKWNLSEENDYPVAVLREMASYLRDVDPYDHAIAVHTHPNDVSDYEQIVGDPLFDSASIQYSTGIAENLSLSVRNMSKTAGRKWIVDMDENGTWDVGVNGSNANEMRCEVLYDVLFSQGGLEWYFGYHPLPLGGDLRTENFRTREEIFRYSRIAREFIEEHLEPASMVPTDQFVTGEAGAFGGAEVVRQVGNRMAIYMPSAAQTPTVDLSDMPGAYQVTWFDPRTGEQVGTGPQLQGGAPRQLEVIVSNPNRDWLVLLRRVGSGN